MTSERKRAFEAIDLLDFEFVSDPHLSPDGTRVAYVRATIDAQQNKYRSAIYSVPVEGGDPARLTSGLYRDQSPRWSPGGEYLAFLSNRDPGTGDDREHMEKEHYGAQLYLLPTRGGEARRITDIEGGIDSFVWSPDGSRIALQCRVEVDGPEYLDHKGATGKKPVEPDKAGAGPDDREKLFKKYNEDVKDIHRIKYRFDGIGYFDDKWSQVLVLDVGAALGAATGDFVDAQQVTTGNFDHSGPAWSPDGSRLVVEVCRADEADLQAYSDLWVFSIDGEEEPVKLTDSVGPVQAPRWSPDEASIAYLGHALEREWYTNTRLWTVASDGSKKPRCLTEDYDRVLEDVSITDMRMGGEGPRPIWSPDGTRVFLPTSDHGTTHLCRVSIETGSVERLTTGDFTIFGYDVAPGAGLVAFAIATPDNPNDIYVAKLEGGALLELTRLTFSNSEFLATRKVSLPERFTFRAQNGPEVDGWVIRPVDFEPGKKYPAVLEIHGGPTAMYTGTFFLEFQLLAAAGMGVIFTNPRGSQGYGEDFCAAIEGAWGTHDYEDVMAGVDAALEEFDWIDPDRLGAAGGSYGGYMTSWLLGHTSRFSAMVSMRAVNDTLSEFGTSDIGYFDERDLGHGKAPWEDAETYLEQSPLNYVGSATTPTLIVHSENDYRCPIGQGEELFVALKKLGVETEFVRYPEESHGLSRGGKPWHRVHRLRKIIEWFRRWLT